VTRVGLMVETPAWRSGSIPSGDT